MVKKIIQHPQELQLDFIQAASVEPEESVSFDFDAHIARLMRRADGIFSDAEDDDEEDDNERKKDGSKADNEEEYDEDGEEFDLEALGISEADFGGPVPDRTKEDSMTASRTKRDLDDQFDVLWAREYGDQAIGNLDEELADEDGLAEQVDGKRSTTTLDGNGGAVYFEGDSWKAKGATGKSTSDNDSDNTNKYFFGKGCKFNQNKAANGCGGANFSQHQL